MKALKWLDDNFEKVILVTLLVIICVTMMFSVIMRRVFSTGITAADEICRYSFVISVFLGCSYSIKINAIFRMASIIDGFKPTARYIMELIMDIALIICFLYFGYHTFGVMRFFANTAAVTDVLRIPKSILFAIYGVSMLLTVVRSIQKLVKDLKKGPSAFQHKYENEEKGGDA